MELAVHLNKVQNAKAVRQAKLHGTTAAYTLQKAHQKRALVLECQVMEEERWTHQAFMEVFRVAMGSCSPKSAGDVSTTNRHKRPVPFLRPRCASSRVG